MASCSASVWVCEIGGEVDPNKVFSSAVDNKILLVSTLLFIAFAQVTTNTLNNVVPPAYALMDVFNISCYASLIPAGLSYWLLMRTMPSAQRFAS